MLWCFAALRDTIRQYYIKLQDNEPVAGLATAKNWVLRGVQNDTVGLHEVLAMSLSGGTGLWTPHTRYTEVAAETVLLHLASLLLCVQRHLLVEG